MTRKTAKSMGLALYFCLMICIPAVLYLEIYGYMIAGIALVCMMFVISMALMWVSEVEENPDKRSAAE
jgi:hypothetical protein